MKRALTLTLSGACIAALGVLTACERNGGNTAPADTAPALATSSDRPIEAGRADAQLGTAGGLGASSAAPADATARASANVNDYSASAAQTALDTATQVSAATQAPSRPSAAAAAGPARP